MAVYYIAFGSNVPPEKEYISRALRLLAKEGEIGKTSSLFISSPHGYAEQRDFTNGALEFRCGLSPRGLLARLKEIEAETGRVPRFKNGPREIDLDIIFCGTEIIAETDLVIPHPLAHKRGFVIAPLNEIAPDFIHPVLAKTVADIFAEISPQCKKTVG